MKNAFFIIGIFLVFIAIGLVVFYKEQPEDSGDGNIRKFSSAEELKNFLKTRQSQEHYGSSYFGLGSERVLTSASPSKAMAGASTDQVSYSRTNIQVEGVDEADIVKSDGKYLYIVSGETISIIEAYPAEDAKIISTIDVNGYPDEIFINENHLIVFGTERYESVPPYEGGPIKIMSPTIVRPYFSGKSFIKIYNINDKANPILEDTTLFDGSYYDSRMIGNNVYVIVNQPIYYQPPYQPPRILDPYEKAQLVDDSRDTQGEAKEEQEEILELPSIVHNGKTLSLVPNDILYFDFYDYSYQLTTIIALDLNNIGEIKKESFLTGYTQNIFVSENNIYLTAQKQIPPFDYQKRIFEKAVLPLMDDVTAGKIKEAFSDENLNEYERQAKIQEIYEIFFNKLSQEERGEFMERMKERSQDVMAEIAKETEKTIAHKISIENGMISYKARGEIPGHLLNQFSMDEYQGNFRVATTTGDLWSGNSLNHIYVLNEGMEIIGKAEDLARGEKIYSVRFMEDRAYLVTFKKVDPLFVIDLSNAENPKVLGELKIPGYSDYLHPYDENHIIGIGKEAVDPTNEESFGRDFAWYQGIKIALFDVSDPANPKEISKFNIGDRGTNSEALYEHKAFLFDREKELLVIPISLHEINKEQYQGEIPATAYGELTFEGAYVLSLNLEDGFALKGRISHKDSEETSDEKLPYWYGQYGPQIRRSLYIENVLYTLSERAVKANSLDDLNEIRMIKLPVAEQIAYPLY